jgi:hypothetical protein
VIFCLRVKGIQRRFSAAQRKVKTIVSSDSTKATDPKTIQEKGLSWVGGVLLTAMSHGMPRILQIMLEWVSLALQRLREVNRKEIL